MSERIVSAVDLPINLNDKRSTLWWGMVGLITVELVVFAALVASFFYLRMSSETWPQGGIELPGLVMPTIGTVILLASSIPVYWADHSIRRGNVRALKIGLVVALVMAAAFLTLKAIEYSGKGFTWTTNAYGSIVWTIIGFHSAHVTAVVLKSVVVLAAAFRGHLSGERNVGVQINGLYWHFVVAVWIPLFFTIYLFDRIF